MKKYISKKIKRAEEQCGLCSAKFQIWLDNLRINEDRKEKMQDRFLGYCPVCVRADER